MARAESFDVVIVGGGPAGIAAACAAAESGAATAMLDDNPAPGGQIWRGRKAPSRQASRWIDRLRRTGARIFHGTTVIAAPQPGQLLAQDATGPLAVAYKELILATGARERFVPFPGWTSPRVLGAGGLQAMTKSGMSIEGKSVVVAGSGPLLMAVADALRKQRARVLAVVEQAPWSKLVPFAPHLLLDFTKLRQAVAIKTRLLRVPYLPSSWPIRAADEVDHLRVTLRTPRGLREIDCDYLACGFFLVPNLELAALLGCRLDPQVGVVVDDRQRTSVPHVFAAGEATGIGGLDKSLIEGQVAGYVAAGRPDLATSLVRARNRSHRFAAALRAAFELRDELKELPQPDTIVCRCEDVAYARLASHTSARDAKLQTRCGMGPCQGRICGPACSFLFDWPDNTPRPPLYPAPLENLA
jgi:NADPH-dependent 2,4-dienoyl-CoA reductase/sulfur reductase-like enzyme